MASLMDTLVDRRANNNAGLIPFPAPTYAQARCFFGSLVRAMYRLEVVGADRLPVTGPMVIAPNHDSLLDGIVLGAAIGADHLESIHGAYQGAEETASLRIGRSGER